MNSRISALILLALALFCASACKKPASFESFVRQDQSVNGCYTFPLEFDDSLATYSISFYTRMKVKAHSSIPVEVMAISPSGEEYSETVYMKIGNRKGDREVYRSGFTPSEYGTWTLVLSPAAGIRNFPGIGVILSK